MLTHYELNFLENLEHPIVWKIIMEYQRLLENAEEDKKLISRLSDLNEGWISTSSNNILMFGKIIGRLMEGKPKKDLDKIIKKVVE